MALTTGRPGRVRRRWWTGLALAAATTSGLAPILTTGASGALQQMAVLVAFLSVVALAGTDVQVTGPTAMAAHLRAVYELGAGRTTLAGALLGAIVVDALVVGAGVSVVTWAATGVVDARPVLVAVAAAASSVLADALMPGRVCADGSMTTSIGAAVLCVFLTVPVLALLIGTVPSVHEWWVSVAGGVTAAILIGGMVCLRQTVTSRPSTFPA